MPKQWRNCKPVLALALGACRNKAIEVEKKLDCGACRPVRNTHWQAGQLGRPRVHRGPRCSFQLSPPQDQTQAQLSSVPVDLGLRSLSPWLYLSIWACVPHKRVTNVNCCLIPPFVFAFGGHYQHHNILWDK